MTIRHAVVTGAAGGIGSACVRMLVQLGWHVFALDLRSPAHTPSTGDAVTHLPCDVSVAAEVERAFARIAARTPILDATLCCTGLLRVGLLESMSVQDFDAIFAVNVRGPWLCARAAIPLLERGATAERPARLVFLSSAAGAKPKAEGGAYAATKAALNSLTHAFAGELAGRQILVNGVAPGAVDTPFARRALEQSNGPTGYRAGGKTMPPLGRIATPDDVAGTMRFLLGDDARYLTGAILTLDGGASAVRR